MTRTKNWIKAFRLRTLPLSFSSILTGAAVALAYGKFNPAVFFLALITTLFLQILSNLANDYGDFVKGTDNAGRIGPERALQGGHLTLSKVKSALFVFGLISLVSGLLLIREGTRNLDVSYSLWFLVAGLAAIAAAVLYTVGKSAYGYRGLGDLFVFLFFGIAGVSGTAFLLSHEWDLLLLLPSAAIGLFSTGVLNLNNLRDHHNDALSGKNTLVVRMGFEKGKQYHALLLLGGMAAALIWLLVSYRSAWPLISLLAFPLIVRNLLFTLRCKVPAELDPKLKQLALATFLFSVLLLSGYFIAYSHFAL